MRKKEEATNEKIIDAGGSEIAGKRNAEQLESEHKKHRAWKIGILIVLVFAAVAYVIGTRWEYKGYKVVESNQTDYSNTASYIRFSDNLLKYTPDGVSYINAKGETVWTTGINMKVPVAVASGDYAVVADMNGNTVCVFSTSGEVSSQTMQYPICDIDVGDQGAFAVVLESEKTNYVNLYTRKGEIVYEIQTSIDKSGYPLDISISDNGEKLFTSYMNVGNMVMENTLAAYNFGEVGQNSNADRLVGSYSFSDQVFSKVQFVDNDTVVAFGTKAIEIYTMKEKPVLKKHIVFNDEIRSIFYGDDYIGVIQKNTNENTDALYTLHAYNLRGKEMFSKSLSFDYDNIFAGKDEIIVTGGNDCAIFRKNGSVKFEGKLKSKIRSVVPSGKHLEYVVVYENETQVIKLKNALPEGSQKGTGNTKTKSDTPVATPANAATPGDAQ